MTMLHVVVSPSRTETRVLAMTSPTDTILKAKMAPIPSHSRALGALLEAIALWQGQQVHAALVAAASAGLSDLRPYRNAVLEDGALYRVDWVPACPSVRRCADVVGLGEFADLRQIALAEGMR